MQHIEVFKARINKTKKVTQAQTSVFVKQCGPPIRGKSVGVVLETGEPRDKSISPSGTRSLCFVQSERRVRR
jgi:hypothetical protein